MGGVAVAAGGCATIVEELDATVPGMAVFCRERAATARAIATCLALSPSSTAGPTLARSTMSLARATSTMSQTRLSWSRVMRLISSGTEGIAGERWRRLKRLWGGLTTRQKWRVPRAATLTFEI